jgi:hypothetical protein
MWTEKCKMIHTFPWPDLKKDLYYYTIQVLLSLAGTLELINLHENVVQQFDITSVIRMDTVNKLVFGLKNSSMSSLQILGKNNRVCWGMLRIRTF